MLYKDRLFLLFILLTITSPVFSMRRSGSCPDVRNPKKGAALPADSSSSDDDSFKIRLVTYADSSSARASKKTAEVLDAIEEVEEPVKKKRSKQKNEDKGKPKGKSKNKSKSNFEGKYFVPLGRMAEVKKKQSEQKSGGTSEDYANDPLFAEFAANLASRRSSRSSKTGKKSVGSLEPIPERSKGKSKSKAKSKAKGGFKQQESSPQEQAATNKRETDVVKNLVTLEQIKELVEYGRVKVPSCCPSTIEEIEENMVPKCDELIADKGLGLSEQYGFKKEYRECYKERLFLWFKELQELQPKLGNNLITCSDSSPCIADPLHIATKHGMYLMVGLLLERGAEKDHKDHLRRPARYYIHRAPEKDALKVAKMLVTTKEDFEPMSWLGDTVVTLAQQEGKEKLLQYYAELSKTAEQ